jgi:gamma-glutamyltranspeptidase/glutathione hydrolase
VSNYRGYDVRAAAAVTSLGGQRDAEHSEACVPKWAPGQTLASLGPRDPKYWHLVVEAKKLAYRICMHSMPIRIS